MKTSARAVRGRGIASFRKFEWKSRLLNENFRLQVDRSAKGGLTQVVTSDMQISVYLRMDCLGDLGSFLPSPTVAE
jgi:hypothetical protein